MVSIPTHLPQGRQTPIKDALIATPDTARRRTAAVIRQEYRSSPPLARSRPGPGTGEGRVHSRPDRDRRRNLRPRPAEPPRLERRNPAQRPTARPTGTLRAARGPRGHRRCPPVTVRNRRHDLPGQHPFRSPGHHRRPLPDPRHRHLVHRQQITALWALATIGPDALAGCLRAVAATQTTRDPPPEHVSQHSPASTKEEGRGTRLITTCHFEAVSAMAQLSLSRPTASVP